MIHPFDQYQRIYIINLATRADRRAEMGEQLSRIGLTYQSSNVRLFEAVRPADPGTFPSIGARGCFLSHLGVLRDATAAGLERILILEDDLNFAKDFMAVAPGVMAGADTAKCSIFYGGYEIDQSPALTDGFCEISSSTGVRTTHFVGFHGGGVITEAADYLTAMLQRDAGHPEGGPMHVDGAYSWFRGAHPQHRTFVAVPQLGYQRASRTDIHSLRWFDRLPAIRNLAGWARRSRNRSEGP